MLGLFLAFSLVTVLALPVLAQNTTDTLGIGAVEQSNISLGGSDLRVTVVKIINTVLGLLGIIALGIVLYGGFVYMTAGGDDAKVSTAKKILVNGVIGLTIILSAFAITKFVLNKLSEATGLNTGEAIDTTLVGDCDTPGTDFYNTYSNTAVCNTFQVCRTKHFFVQSITPSTKDVDVVGMNNVVVRAVFSQPVGSGVSNAIKIEKDGLDITDKFDLSFVENKYVIEARPKTNDGCGNTAGGHCLSKGNYKISILEVKDESGNALEVTTDCGTFPKDANFDVGVEVDVIDSTTPTLSNVTLDNQSGDSIHLVSGNIYPIKITINDRVGPILYGGNSYVVLNVYKGGFPNNILKTYVNAPAISLGSSNSFSYDYSYRVPTDLELNTDYILDVVGHDIDNNVTHQFIKFRVVPASCNNNIQDSNETGVDSGGVCGGGLGDSCKVQTDCSTSYQCLNPENNICAGTGDCVCTKWPYIESVNPDIYGQSQMDGAPGNWITISGRNFGNTPGEVSFNYDVNDDNVIDYSQSVSLAQCSINGVLSNVWNNFGIIVELPAPLANVGTTKPSISVKNLELVGTNSSDIGTVPVYSSSLLNGKVLDLHLDESSGNNIVDSSGKGNNLQVVGPITYGLDGKFGKAFGFEKDADSSSVTTSESGFLRLRVNSGQSLDLQQGSVFAWIKKSSPVIYADTIVSKSSSYGLFVASNGQLAVGEWYTDGLDHGGSTGRVISSGTNVVDGQWHQVGLVFNHGVENSTKLYVDGDLVFTTTTQFYTGYLGDFVVGANNGGGAQFYTGLIDEVNVWNRVLSQEEITSLYNTVAPSYKFTDFTNDSFGPNLGLFTYNEINRPGLCAVQVSDTNQPDNHSNSASPKTNIMAVGKAFGSFISSSKNKLLFGEIEAGIRSVDWSDLVIKSSVPFANTGKNTVYVEVNGEKSNPVLFTVLDSNTDNLPIITNISPATTTPGSYITISGTNFGWSEGVVSINGVNTPSLPAFCGTGWKDTQIIVKVPVNAPIGNDSVVITRTDISKSSSGDNSVNVEVGPARPSICKIEPDSGPAPLAGDDVLTLKGENFASFSPKFYFWKKGSIEANYSTWLSTDSFTNVSGSIGEEVKISIPVGEDGTSMSSGSIVVKANNNFSNGINYEVVDCRLPNQQTPTGYQCCQIGPEAGIWKVGDAICQGTIRDAGYAWRFTTGKIPERFEVLEQCTSGSSVVPSPTPWSARDQGRVACINAQIQAKFSLPVDSATVSTTNIHIFTCNGDKNNVTDCGIDVTASQFDISIDSNDTIVLNPKNEATLGNEQWYRVALSGNLQSSKSVTVANRPVVEHEPLQATRPCTIGTSNFAYCFDFRTGKAEDICVLTGAGINPSSATTTILGVVQDVSWPLTYDLEEIFKVNSPNIHPQFFDVYGISNQQCIVIDVDNKDWHWGPEVVESGSNSPATAIKFVDDSHKNSRGVATAWQNNPSGSDIFAKYENTQNSPEVLNRHDVLTESGLAKPYTISSLSDAKVISNSNYHLVDGNFELVIKFKLDNIPTSTVGFTQNVNGDWEKTSYLLKDFVSGGLIYIKDNVSSSGNVQNNTRKLNFLLGNYSLLNSQDIYTDNRENVLIFQSTQSGVVSVNINGYTLSVGHIISSQNTNIFLGSYAINSGSNGAFFHGSITDFTIGKKETVVVHDTIEATSTIHINLGDPSVTDKWPSCTEACINAQIGAKFNQIMIPNTYISPSGGIELYKCADENCEAGDLSSPLLVDIHTDSNSSITMYSSQYMATSTWYLVKINNSILASGGIDRDSNLINGNPVQPTQWKFKTKNSSEPCAIDTVDVVPDPFSAYYIGQKQIYKAVPRGAVDSCSSQGQVLDPWGYGWDWSVQNNNIATTTQFSISGKYNNFCTQNCLPKGSNISYNSDNVNYALCGNGKVDPGEDCDIAIQTENPGVSCTYSCLRPGNKALTCGDGIVETILGEECDPNSVSLTESSYCTNICLRTGSSNQATGDVTAPICGSGARTTGEDCDGGSGCSTRCLNIGTQLSQAWCDNNLTASSTVSCQNAVSVCGNDIVESGEECDSDSASCNDECLLKNVCDISGLKQCNKGEAGCNNDCTFAGSSLSYTSPSICGDGVGGVGEATSTIFSGGSYSCELSSSSGKNILGGSPTQIVTSVGLPDFNDSLAIIDKLTTHIFAVPVKYYDDKGNPTSTKSGLVKGSGEYNLMCGYTEYPEIQNGTYNDCPNNSTSGSINNLGVGTNSCCYYRPMRYAQYPAVNAGVPGSNDGAVCRNTYLEVDFPGEMNSVSFNDNVVVIEGYDQNTNYRGYNCENHGQTTVTAEINGYLGIIPFHTVKVDFWQNIWLHIKTFFADLFTGKVFAASPAKENSGLDHQVITWCATKIAVTPTAYTVYGTKVEDEKNVSFVSSTNVGLLLAEPLDPNVYVVMMLKGGKDGIKDKFGVGIKNPHSSSVDDYWLFKTGSDICKIKNIEVDPPKHVFITPTSNQDFTINIISNTGGQLITPIPNFYDWKYSWSPSNNAIFTIPNNNSSTISIVSKGVEGQIDALASVEVISDSDTENSQVGNIFSKNFKLTAFFCANPWPTSNTNVTGSDSDKVSIDGLLEDNTYNFSFIYCADNNNPLTVTDDLPLFNSVKLLSNNLDDYGVGDVALRRYLLFANETNDALGIQVFENTPNFDGTPRSLEDWYISKFNNLGDMKPASVAGYEALSNGNNYYVSVFDVDKTINPPLGTVYNYVILFSLNENASQDTTKVFEQIINNLKFNIKMTDYNKCLGVGGDATLLDSSVIRSGSSQNNITNVDCNTDFDCRDSVGLPLANTSGYCNNEETKFYRDLNRLNSLRVAQHNLDNYFTSDSSKNGFVGALNSGSFIPGYSTSKWQNSWGLLNSYAGSVAVDPINQWAGCGDHDPLTCWSAVSSTYICPQFAEVYEYKFVSSTQSYNIYAPFEYLQSGTDDSFVSRYIDMNKIQFGRSCTPLTKITYSASNNAVCGDGVINVATGEECEPPNMSRCDVDTNTIIKCNPNSCTWDTIASSCDALKNKSCGDGIVESGYTVTTTGGVDLKEQCDDGVLNGRYGHCDINCQLPGATTYTGPGACGDGVKQSQYEYCEKNDLTDSVCTGNNNISCSSDRDCGVNIETQVPQYEVKQSECKGSDGEQKFCKGVTQQIAPIACNKNVDCTNINQEAYCGDKLVCMVDEVCVNPPGAVLSCRSGTTEAVVMGTPISCSSDKDCSGYTYMNFTTTTEVSFSPAHGFCSSSTYSRGFCSGDKTRSCSSDATCDVAETVTVEGASCIILSGQDMGACMAGDSLTGTVCTSNADCGTKIVTNHYGHCESVNEPTYDFQKINSCSYDCSTAGGYCGDDITQLSYEECDDANSNNDDACKIDCTLPAVAGGQAVCGNNFVESGEQCDDNNITNGDGCSSSCQIEVVKAICGDGKVAFDDKNGNGNKDEGELNIEECDTGIQNGSQCTPSYGQSCTYCSATCTTQTKESPQFCGNGQVDKDDKGNWLEACDYRLTDGVQTTVTVHREQGDVGDVSCESEQKGNYQCANNCQLVQNSCITCGVGANLPLPQIGIINPMVTGGDSKYTSDPFIALLKEKSPGDYEYFFQTIPNPINYDEVNGIFTSSSVQHNLITKPFSDKGLETNSQCSYKLIFNPTLISDSSEPVNNKISNDLADVFDYPVNNEVGVVNNEVIMSPAVTPEYIRVVVRWKKNGGINFVGNFYSDKITDAFSTSYRYSNAQSVNGLYDTMSEGLGGVADMNGYVYPHAVNNSGYTDGLQRFAFHPIIFTDYSGTQAITFMSNSNRVALDEPIPSSTLGFYVSSPNDQMDRLKDNDLWVEVYHYHMGQVNMFSIYKPDFVFKLSNARPSAGQSAKYWHVFNIHMYDSHIVVSPIDSTWPEDPGQYLDYMNSNPFTTNYAGALVTGECGVRANMPNTTKCNY